MPSITKQRIGNNVYLDESVSFWDSVKKRPDNHKTRIGKIDPVTSEALYKQEYLDRLAAEGKSIEGMRAWDKTKEARTSFAEGSREGLARAIMQVLDTVKCYGVTYFCKKLPNP
jgi:hypothetical protein